MIFVLLSKASNKIFVDQILSRHPKGVVYINFEFDKTRQKIQNKNEKKQCDDIIYIASDGDDES